MYCVRETNRLAMVQVERMEVVLELELGLLVVEVLRQLLVELVAIIELILVMERLVVVVVPEVEVLVRRGHSFVQVLVELVPVVEELAQIVVVEVFAHLKQIELD